MITRYGKFLLFCAFGGLLGLPQALASSNLAAGSFAQAVQTGQSEQDVGICRLLTGPRDGLKDNRFVLTLADSNVSDGEELRITGKFKEEGSKRSGRRDLRLLPDDEETAEYLEDLLRAHFNDPKLQVRLHTLEAEVDEVKLPGKVNQFICKVRLTGRVASKEIARAP